MSIDNSEITLNKADMEKYFREIGNILKKKYKLRKSSAEIILVGGAVIVMNYGFRQSTIDVDCIDASGILMNDLLDEINHKYNLPDGWINTDFMASKSFSNKLIQYSSFFKTYGNGALNVRIIKDEYLLAMKVVSGRKYKNDYSDIIGIIEECKSKGKTFNITDIKKAIIDLYGTTDDVKEEMFVFLNEVLSGRKWTYDGVREFEIENSKTIHSFKHRVSAEEFEKYLKEIK